ncbi:MAG: penicillin acylase family protein, partial [Flavobacteriales bacterium]|nr:penicillin acylase family protein [Flavobacteriales bacterium]
MRAMINVLKALGLVLVVLALCLFTFIQTSGTDYSFQLKSDAVSGPVDVVFDDMAVPHIYAETEDDAMYALGYIHASERLWQMDLLRRAGAGELSALLGPDMVANDQYLRTLGMREAAAKVALEFAEKAPSRIQTSMAAYLNGVNRFIAEGDTPLEYLILGSDPEPFDTHDVYCATGFMSYSFAIHLKTEPILDWMKGNLDAKYF